MEPVPVAEPWTPAEIARDLTAVREWSARFWQRFDVPQFFAPINDGWSPADHVRHLVKSNRPVVTALGLPKIVLLLRFGMSRKPSAPYSQLVARYHGELAGGLKAGPYSASPLPAERRTAEQRQESLAYLDQTQAALARLVAKWGERGLDRLRLPHPAMGPLTVREMEFFTLYHNTHHVLGPAKNLGL